MAGPQQGRSWEEEDGRGRGVAVVGGAGKSWEGRDGRGSGAAGRVMGVAGSERPYRNVRGCVCAHPVIVVAAWRLLEGRRGRGRGVAEE